MIERIVIVAGPGKLGIHLIDSETTEVNNVVSAVNCESPLSGKVFRGDNIISINGSDVHKLGVAGIYRILHQQLNNEKTIVIAREVPDGLELVRDNGPRLPIGAAEAVVYANKMKIQENGPYSTDLPTSKGNVEIIDEEIEPPSFDASQFDGSMENKARQAKVNVGPSREDFGEGVQHICEHRNELHEEEDEESAPAGLVDADNCQVDSMPPNSDNQDSLPRLEAYLVEEVNQERVVDAIAVPLLPWWKQRRTKMLLSFFCLILVSMAIAMGVALSSSDGDSTMDTAAMDIATDTTAPTTSPSSVQMSTIPTSTSPSYCEGIVPIRQKIDLWEIRRQPKVAVDGNNMVILVGEWLPWSNTHYTMFYLLSENGWVKKRDFAQEYTLWSGWSSQNSYHDVSISDNTAFVGLYRWGDDGNEIGIVFVYEQDEETEDWRKVEDPFVMSSNATFSGFGSTVVVDGDLACIGDYIESTDYIEPSRTNMYLFHRDDNNKWVQFDHLENVEHCSIEGGVIALQPGKPEDAFEKPVVNLYSYLDGGIVPLQDEIAGGKFWSMGSDGNRLVGYGDDHVTLWHRDETDEMFTFRQQLSIGIQIGSIMGISQDQLAVDKDLIVTHGLNQNRTLIFSERDGYWVETQALNETYDSFQLSGRNLLAWRLDDDAVYYYDLEICTS